MLTLIALVLLSRTSVSCFECKIQPTAGADPGFPIGGGANCPGGGATYEFANFPQKLHEIEKISGRRGGGAPGVPPKSTNEQYKHSGIPSLSRKNLSQSASYVNKLYHSTISRNWLGAAMNCHKLKKHCLLLQIQHADYFGCSARPACSGFLVFSCLFTPK